MNKPLISIITATFNSEQTIVNTIESILGQTYSNIEYIIIDGNSKDDTVSIIQSFTEKFKAKKIGFKWTSETDNGIYDAFNKGIKLAKGNWISFLGSDDIYTQNAIELYVKNIPKSAVDFLYSNIQIKGKRINTGVWTWRKFKRRMNIAHVGAFHNKNYFKKYGMFDTSYIIAGDYEILLRAKDKLRAHKVHELTVIMGGDGVSNKHVRQVYKETTRAKIEMAEVPLIICYLDYSKWIFKYTIKRIVYALVR